MRLRELLGAKVVDQEGNGVGDVHDLRVRRSEAVPPGEGVLVVEGLVTGVGALQARLGYAYGDVDGPWVLRWALGRLGRRARYVPWGSVTTFEHGVVTIRGRAGDLRHPSDADRAGT